MILTFSSRTYQVHSNYDHQVIPPTLSMGVITSRELNRPFQGPSEIILLSLSFSFYSRCTPLPSMIFISSTSLRIDLKLGEHLDLRPPQLRLLALLRDSAMPTTTTPSFSRRKRPSPAPDSSWPIVFHLADFITPCSRPSYSAPSRNALH